MKKKRYPTKRAPKKSKNQKPTQAEIEKKEAEIAEEDLKDFAAIHSQGIREGLFCIEYIKDFNGAQAAIRAGYSDNPASAAVTASRLLRKANIQQNINKRIKHRMVVQELNSDNVLQALWQNHERCAQAVPVLDMEGKPTGVWKFDAKGSNKALELIGRHFDTFPTKVTHANDKDNPLPAGTSQVVFYLPDNGRHPKSKT